MFQMEDLPIRRRAAYAVAFAQARENQKRPGPLRRAASFARSAARHVAAGLPMVSDEEKERRLTICRGCPNLTPQETCAVCTCPMKRKASWALEHCPLNPPLW